MAQKVGIQDFKFCKGCHSQCISHFYAILGVFFIFRLNLGFLCVVLMQPFMRQKVVGALYLGFFSCVGAG